MKNFLFSAGLLLAFFISLAIPINKAQALTCETAFGVGTAAKSYCSFVVGSYNYISGSENLTTWVATDPLFVVGNGTSAAATKNALTILKNGNVGIGTNTPTQVLDVMGVINSSAGFSSKGSMSLTGSFSSGGNVIATGNSYVNGTLGVILNAQNRPLITRAWDKFTAGNYLGVGRWGLFMEPYTLTVGTPNIAGNGRVQFVRYNLSSGIDLVTMMINELGNVGIGTTNPTQKLEVNGNIKLSGSIISNGDICIGKCL